MLSPAVFFDRDNTLNIDSGYIGDSDSVELFQGVGEGLYRLKNECGFKLIVISNQSGVARGLITHEQVRMVNKRINELLEESNTRIDAFYYCPFHPDFNSAEESSCRKPSPNLVFKAADELNLDLTKSYFVGDMVSDIECGINASLKTILIDYQNDEGKIISLKNRNKTPNFRTDNFLNACDFIVRDFNGENALA